MVEPLVQLGGDLISTLRLARRDERTPGKKRNGGIVALCQGLLGELGSIGTTSLERTDLRKRDRQPRGTQRRAPFRWFRERPFENCGRVGQPPFV